MSNQIKTYKGNDVLKGAGVAFEWTQEQLDEWLRCAEDPIYFAENYLYIVNVDKGMQLCSLYDYQKEMIQSSVKHAYTAVCASRQSGKCSWKNTKCTVRHKQTGEVYELTAEQFHTMVSDASNQ